MLNKMWTPGFVNVPQTGPIRNVTSIWVSVWRPAMDVSDHLIRIALHVPKIAIARQAQELANVTQSTRT